MRKLKKLIKECHEVGNWKCASMIMAYDPALAKLEQKLFKEHGWTIHYPKHTNGKEPVGYKRNMSLVIKRREVCFSSWRTRESQIVQQATVPKGFEALVARHAPIAVALLVRDMIAHGDRYHDAVEDPHLDEGKLTFNKNKLEASENWKVFKEAFNALMKGNKWATEHFVDKTCTIDYFLEKGVIIDTKKLTSQKLFAIAMLIRAPLEHREEYTRNYMHWRSKNVPINIAATLALFTGKYPTRGYNHDFTNGLWVTEECWEAIMKGTWEPKWTRTGLMSSKSRDYGVFELFQASSWGTDRIDVNHNPYVELVGTHFNEKLVMNDALLLEKMNA